MLPGEKYDTARKEKPGHTTHWYCKKLTDIAEVKFGININFVESGCCCTGHVCESELLEAKP